MFWRAYALGAVSANAIENVIDKIALVKHKEIDSMVATFYRVAAFTAVSVLLGVTGVFGKMTLNFSLPIVGFAALSVISSVFYTYLLKKVEISANGVLSYLTPFFFLLFDLFIFKVSLVGIQIFGIMLLVLGGLFFVFNPRTLRLRSQYTPLIWGIFLFNLVLSGAEYYLFQHYHAVFHLNEISYIVSVWLSVALGLFLVILVQQKGRLIQKKNIEVGYLKVVAISKSIDAIGTLLWFRALSLATVSQVDAMESFYPLILIIAIFAAQKIFKLNVEEDLTSSNVAGKIVGVIFLCLGGILAS